MDTQKMLDTSDEARSRKLSDLQRSEEQLEEARKRLSRLHDAIELGTMSARDADVRERLKNRRAEIDGLNATVASLRQQLDRGPTSITLAAVARFGEVVRQRLIEGDSKARQKIVHAFVKTVRVGERIKIEGETDALVQGVAALARAPGSVPSFDRKWCQKRHHIRPIFPRIFKYLWNSVYAKSPQKARKDRLMHWFDAFFGTRN